MANKEMVLAILLIAGIFVLSSLFKDRDVEFHPNCDIQPNNEGCKCYGGTVRLEQEDGSFECIQPECSSTESAQQDCRGRLHISCLGEWTCINNLCQWTCT